MAYLAPIHRPTSIRHALKLNFLDPQNDCLVVAKSNQLEFYTQTAEGLSLQHSKAIYGRVTMLQKLRPAPSRTDHLFIGTDRSIYFTLSWNAEKKQLQTEKIFEGVADNAARESQTGERCHVDPSGRFMTLEVYEGIITVIPLVQRGKKRKQESEVSHLGDPISIRVSEMFVRSSTFLWPRSADDKPKFALLYEDTDEQVKLKLCEISFANDNSIELDDGESCREKLGQGSSHLIPVEGPSYGVVIIGETSIKYYSDETGILLTQPLEEATIFVAWARIDAQRFVLADDYGYMYLFMLVVDTHNRVQTWKLDMIGKISRPSVLVYLDAGHVFIGSHQGDSQLIKILEGTTCVIESWSNLAPILDFVIMDIGVPSTTEGRTNRLYSTQARIVTGSGADPDGSLRSVRSGIGLEDLSVLGEMEHISNLFSLKSDPSSNFVDTLLVAFMNETRIFRFDPQGEAEEMEELFAGLAVTETTITASNISQGRIIQVTDSQVRITSLEDEGMLVSYWKAPDGRTITAASTNDSHVLVSLGGLSVIVLSIDEGLKVVKEKTYDGNSQVSCIALPAQSGAICFLGFWRKTQISVCSINTLDLITSVQISKDSVPRSLLLTQIFPNQPPTLFIALADGNVVTYMFNPSTNELTGSKSIILGTQQASFRALPRGNGLFSVFATCEYPSLIYSSEGRLEYSAITTENAMIVCPFNSEAYPDSVAIATSDDVRIALVDTERTTIIRTMKTNYTIRRLAYSPRLKILCLAGIGRKLRGGEEISTSIVKIVDEVHFKALDTYPLNENELIECIMCCELPDGSGELAERFVVGTSYLDDLNATAARGRIILFEITEDKVLKIITEIAVKGGCRCLAMCRGKIVAAQIKTIVIYNVEYKTGSKPDLVKTASFRCSTAPIDMTVNGSFITIADLMKSAVVVEYRQGATGLPDTIIEIARHFQTTWTTAIAEVDENTYLEGDAEGNLVVLYHDPNGVTQDDKKRLNVSSEMQLGEMANRIRRIDIATASDAVVVPRAFIATSEGSLYIFGFIAPDYQNLLMTLQSNLSEIVTVPGAISFAKYRAFKNQVREAEEPYRFVDGDLVARFLDLSDGIQTKAVEGLGVDVETMKAMIEKLRKLVLV